MAAKRLQDLAQGYGSRENIAVVVVRLMLSEAERQRVQESLATQRESQRELLRVLSRRSDLLELRDGVPPTAELSNVIIDRAGRAKKTPRGGSSSPHLIAGGGGEGGGDGDSPPLPSKNYDKQKDGEGGERRREGSGSSKHARHDRQSKAGDQEGEETPQHMWESVLSKRLAEEVKSKELKHAFLHDDDDDAEDNVIDFSLEHVPSATNNWRAETKRRKGDSLQVSGSSESVNICV